MQQAWVVDTNVLIVANGGASQADNACEDACEKFLGDLYSSFRSLVLDEGGEILAEYAKHCSHSGAPGLGDHFFAWAFSAQHTSCLRVPLEKNEDGSYADFPKATELSKFDPSDRKFVAAALACDEDPTIANAVDSDWLESRAALDAAAVRVHELCPGCLKSVE